MRSLITLKGSDLCADRRDWSPLLPLRCRSKSAACATGIIATAGCEMRRFILLVLMGAGYRDEAASWREWLLRAIAGSPAQMQTIYGVRGERRLDEYEIPWLSGYENSRPVRIGNAASNQFQLDVYGEVLAAMWQAASCRHQNDRAGLGADGRAHEISRITLAQAGRRNLGSARRPASISRIRK